jgi:hypothetical protein
LERAKHVGRAVHKLRSTAGEGGCLETAAKLLSFFVERSYTDIRMRRFKAQEFVVKKIAFGRAGLVPDRDRTACVAVTAAGQRRDEGGCEAKKSRHTAG